MKYLNLLFILILLINLDLISQTYNWERVFNGTITVNEFVGIDNFDSLNIMAIDVMSHLPNSLNRVVKSTDGGITWDTVYKDFIFKDSLIQALSISYPTKDYCVIGTYKNYIIKTTDGGKNWSYKRLDIKQYAGLREINIYDYKHGITCDLRDLVVTHDGFETYKIMPAPMYGNYKEIAMISPDEIYVVVLDILKKKGDTTHVMFKTTDEGATWEKVGVIIYPYFYSSKIKFIDNEFGYIVGSMQVAIGMLVSNVIYRTKDGGNSWQKVLDTIVPWNAWGIQEIDILDRKTAIATSQFGVVYWTHDGGDSWQLDSSGVLREDAPATLYPCILGEHTALIADFRDRITRSSLKPTGIKEDEDYFIASGSLIYPNPATDFITLQGEFLALNNVPFIEIYDVMGIKVQTIPYNLTAADSYKLTPALSKGEGVRIDVSELSPGVYFVKIGDKVEKFVKM